MFDHLFLFVLTSLLLVIHPLVPTESPPNLGKWGINSSGSNWAVLLAGSGTFQNYRHQANVAHAYHILRKNGLLPENIITMMHDDVAWDSQNPYNGTLFNSPGTINFRQGLVVDYDKDDVSVQNFLSILDGVTPNVTNTSRSLKILKPNSSDIVVIYLCGHGGLRYFYISESPLTAHELLASVRRLASKVSKILILVESCFSGSLFKDTYPDLLPNNVFVITATDDKSSSYACYWDDDIGTYLSDEFSSALLEDIQKLDLSIESVAQLIQVLSIETQSSNVTHFGNSSFLNSKLDLFLGSAYDPTYTLDARFRNYGTTSHSIIDYRVPQHDAQLATYANRINSTKSKDSTQLNNYDLLIQSHIILESVFHDLETLMPSEAESEPLSRRVHQDSKLMDEVYKCFSTCITHFSRICVNPEHVHKSHYYLGKFFNMCSLHLDSEKIIKAVTHVCINHKRRVMNDVALSRM